MRDWKVEVQSRLQTLSVAPERQSEIVEELSQYMRDRYEELRAEGHSVRDAETLLVAELDRGNLLQQLRSTECSYSEPIALGGPTGNPLTGFLQDMRYACRVLRASPGFTIVCVISLALGIGANTAMFQLINAGRLRALPVPHPQQLAMVQFKEPHTTNGIGMGRYHDFTYGQWKQIEAQQQGFRDIAAFATDSWDLSNGGEVHNAHGMYVSGKFFRALEVTPMLGRLFGPSDDTFGCSTGAAVISYSFWQREMGGEANVIGRTFTLDRHPFQVIGVTPANFYGIEVGRMFDVAIPLCTEPVMRGEEALTPRPQGWWIAIFGRLKAGWSLPKASAQLTARSAGIMEATLPPTYPPDIAKAYLGSRIEAVSGANGYSRLRQEYETPLMLLLGVCGIVLLIACANLANLMLARASVREREIAVRLALGASRGRLLRQLMTECLLLAFAGAAAGVGLATSLSSFLVRFLSTRNSSIYLDGTLDLRVLGFTVALAAATCLLFGLIPSVKTANAAPAQLMNSNGRSVTATRERFGMRRMLATLQIALSVVLLVGALLFVRTLRNLSEVDVGFQPSGILIVNTDFSHLSLPLAGRVSFRELLLDRVREQPGIESAAETGNVPMSGWGWNNQPIIHGVHIPVDLNESRIGPGYFRTLSIPLLAGRDFDAGDTRTSQRVAIVNQQFARKLLAGVDPVGKTFQVVVYKGELQYTFQIVGVVKDTKHYHLREEIAPMAYYPQTQDDKPETETNILVRSSLPISTVMSEVKDAVMKVNGGVELEFDTMDQQIAEGLLRERLLAALSAGFGVLAAILATIGVYGMISYMVVRRTNEIGVRMALGARPATILQMIVGEAATLLGIGVVAGMVVGIFAMRAASSLLYGLKAYDPWTFAMAAVLLSVVTITASLIPATRAARIDPIIALREQ